MSESAISSELYRSQETKFIEGIKERELPIEADNAKAFAQYVLAQNPPDGFLERLTAGLQYKSEEAFENDFQSYAESLKGFFNSNEPYAVAFDDLDGSGRWIYEKLLNAGIPAADYHFYLDMYPEVALVPDSGLIDIRQIQDVLPVGAKVFAPDDFALTGTQMTDLMTQIQGNFNDRNKHPYQVLVACMYTSESADQTMNRQDPSAKVISLSERIKPVDDFLLPNDIGFINRLISSMHEGDVFYGDNALFWTWYKVPDNISSYEIFTEPKCGQLINVDQFKQPYRS